MSSISDTLGHALAGGIVFRLNMMLFGRRSRERAAPVDGRYIFRRGKVGAAVGLSFVAGAAGCGVACVSGRGHLSETALVQTIAGGALLAFVGSLFVSAAMAVKYTFTDDGIEHRILWWTRKIEWIDIEKIDLGIFPYELILRSERGAVTLTFLMVGSGTMVELLLQRVRGAALENSHGAYSALRRIEADLPGRR